jgi:hypothetical protein
MEEQWLPINNFELYLISNTGQVYSHYKQGILKTRLDKDGYEVVNLYNDKRMFTFKVHRLVLEAFSPEKESGQCSVNHIDGNKTNNNLVNLEWCSSLENSLHAVEIGLIKTIAIQAIDKKSGQVVLEYESTRAAETDGYQHSNISACLNGKRKTHKGLIWRKKED